MIRCFKYQLKEVSEGVYEGCARVLPPESITGIYVDGWYYGASIIDDLSVLSEWNAVEITKEEFDAKCKQPDQPSPLEMLVNIQKERRRKAYQEEADPIFFKYQRGEATKEEWIAKIEEIRDRFKY